LEEVASIHAEKERSAISFLCKSGDTIQIEVGIVSKPLGK
jgi:hypothetical protein